MEIKSKSSGIQGYEITQITNNHILIKIKLEQFLEIKLSDLIKKMADSSGSRIENFHIQERSLYNSIAQILDEIMPYKGFYLLENNLYKVDAKLSTDISILSLKDIFNSDRKDKDLDFSAFFEIKTLFRDEILDNEEIIKDLSKLHKCYEQYNKPNCLFIFMATFESLKKHLDKYPQGFLQNFLELTPNKKKFKATSVKRQQIHNHNVYLTGKSLASNEGIYTLIFQIEKNSSEFQFVISSS